MAIQSTNPATGETVRSFEPLTAKEVDARIGRAADAFERWRQVPIADRVKVVRAAAGLLDDRRDRYARLATLEMGKLVSAARDEVAKCALACRFYADNGPAFVADQPVVETDQERGYVAYHPLGVVLAVMPWNFPFWQVIRYAAPALVAGNVCVLKHASNVPQCALALEELFRDAGAPDGVFQTLLVGSDAVADIIRDPRVAAVTLTGSDAAGRSVARAAGEHLKKAVLELGGSDPFIVMPSANLDRAVETAVRARTINNGQSCIAAKRFIVHEQVAPAFTERFLRAMAALRVGDPQDPATQVGPLVSAQAVDDLERQVTDSVNAGARILTGGTRRPGAGYWFEPTVLTDIPPDAPAYRDELFGPVASLFVARDATDAARIANDTRFGLGASVWTTDADDIAWFTREITAGSVFVNGMVASDPRFPFGGVKASGYGRELADVGMREFVNIKTVRVFQPGGTSGQDKSATE